MTTIVDGTAGVTFPAGGVGNPAGAVVGTTDTQTLTNKTLTGAVMNGTVGATTPATGAFTTLSSTTGVTFATSSGNVGIGTASPTVKLDVVGGRTFLSAASETYACGVKYVSTGGAVYFGAASSSATPDAVFSNSGGAERMRITDGGNVGIGTSSPGALLHVGTTTAKIRIGATAGSEYLDISRDSATGNMIYNAAQASYGTHNFQIAGTEAMRIDSSGNVRVTNVAGLGYGTGSGGTVTQATSKTTTVTLNKPTGRITMNNAALGSATSASFRLNNSIIGDTSVVIVNGLEDGVTNLGAYRVEVQASSTGSAVIRLTNISAGSLSEAMIINFVVINGATS